MISVQQINICRMCKTCFIGNNWKQLLCSIKINDKNTGYHSSVVITKDIIPHIKETIANYIGTDDFLIEKRQTYGFVSAESLKDKETLELLVRGDIPISAIIVDKAANDYIDQFKGELNDEMLKYLKETLNVSTSDPEVPMQLLCNLKCPY